MHVMLIKVITKLPNSEQSYKGKVKTHNYINRQILHDDRKRFAMNRAIPMLSLANSRLNAKICIVHVYC